MLKKGAFLFFCFAVSFANAIDIAPDQLCRRVSAEITPEVSFQKLIEAGFPAPEAARAVAAQREVTRMLQEGYDAYSANPANKGLTREQLWQGAVDRVRRKMPAGQSHHFEAALNRIEARGKEVFERAQKGEQELSELAKLFNNPTEALKGMKTSEQEDFTIAMLAFQRLTKQGADVANASHIMDLILASQDPVLSKAFAEAGVSPLEMARNILLHDLGKQYNDPALANYRAFLETAFPDKTKNFLNTQIMPHEFGSMIILAELAKEAGIPTEKVPRLQALLANHNAGYRPDLSGFHFWAAGFAWPQFARAMKGVGIDLPETYGPVLHQNQGGDSATAALASLDRLVSLSLASQEKFSMKMVNSGTWNTETMVGELRANLKSVPQEVSSVGSRFRSYVDKEKAAGIQSALAKYGNRLGGKTRELADKLEKDALIAPAPSSAIVGTSIAYQTKEGTWYRVTGTGQAFKWSGTEWGLFKEVPKGQTPQLFYREIVMKDLGYEVPTLTLPLALRR